MVQVPHFGHLGFIPETGNLIGNFRESGVPKVPAIALLNGGESTERFILSFCCQSSDVLQQIQP